MGVSTRMMVTTMAMIALSTCFLHFVQASTSSSVGEFIDKTISSHKIVIFSKSYCPYCKRVKAAFKELNQVPFVVELDERGTGT
ncbi:hypothetical protein Lal_00011053 [Lupinus albus]|nr:hypothetical protein Lal_00011053 [Lupinus albus]